MSQAEQEPGLWRPNFVVADDPIAEIETIEAKAYSEATAELHQEIGRVEMLGTEDPTRQSLHTYYVNDERFLVWFSAQKIRGLGRTFRTIVNRLHLTGEYGTDFEEVAHIEDYLFANNDNTITCQSTWLARNRQDTWYPVEDTGPILHKKHDHLSIAQGPQYKVWAPETAMPELLLDRMSRLQYVGELTDILRHLNKITLEPQMERFPVETY